MTFLDARSRYARDFAVATKRTPEDHKGRTGRYGGKQKAARTVYALKISPLETTTLSPPALGESARLGPTLTYVSFTSHLRLSLDSKVTEGFSTR